VEQELLSLPEHLSSPPFFSGVRVTRSFVLCVFFVDRCLCCDQLNLSIDKWNTPLQWQWHDYLGGGGVGLGLWYLTPLFQQYFSCVVAISFIGGGNRIRAQTCRMIILSYGPMFKSILFKRKKHMSGFDIHYHKYHSSSYRPLCYINTNVYLHFQNGRYSICTYIFERGIKWKTKCITPSE